MKFLCGRVEGLSYKWTEQRGRANSATPDPHLKYLVCLIAVLDWGLIDHRRNQMTFSLTDLRHMR
jgi:hypothetical protein